MSRRSPPRIVSLLPAATEMAFALGLGEAVVGVSHECDYPPEARRCPVVVRPALALDHLDQRQIDAAVSQRLAAGQSLYEIDQERLQQLRPDLILTQDLCAVCAPSGQQLAGVLEALALRAAVLPMTPHTLEDVFEDLRALGRATARLTAAERLIEEYRARLERVRASVAEAPRERIFVMEWTDPIYCSGHWVPQMIALAGGVDALARPGRDSVRIAWQEVLDWAPEVLIVAPCGCTLAQALKQVPRLRELSGWAALPAVREGRVFGVDANAYFARPGPRLIEGTELLAHLLHSERLGWAGSADAFARIAP